MDPIRLKLALKRRPAVDAVLRSAAWPVLQAQRLGADWAAWRRGRGAYDPNSPWLPPLQGKYRGRSCFVVGTGPSLCLEDLERIRPALFLWGERRRADPGPDRVAAPTFI